MPDTPHLLSAEAYLPKPATSAAPLIWAAHPVLGGSIRKWAIPLSRAVGFYQRTKLFSLKMFLESPATVKDLQLRLGLRRPGDVARYFFEYRKQEARTGAIMDMMEVGLDMDIRLSHSPVGEFAPDFKFAVLLGEKVFAENSKFTQEEVEYVLSGKVIYWNWRGERPTFDD